MDISKDIKDSLALLNKHKILVLPGLASTVLTYVMIVLFLVSSGALPVLMDLQKHYSSFDNERQAYITNLNNMNDEDYSLEFLKYASKDSSDSPYNEEFSTYLISQGFDLNRINLLFSFQNLVLFLAFLGLIIFLIVYAGCLTNVMTAQAIRDDKFTRLFSESFMIFFKIIGLIIIMSLILIAPLIALIPLIMLITVFPLLVLLLIAFIFAYFAYIIYIILKMYFSNPILVFEKKWPMESIKQSFEITKGQMKTILLLCLINYGIAILMNGVSQGPQMGALQNMIFASNLALATFGLLIFAILVVAQAIIATFLNAFMYYAYLDFKKNPSLKQDKKI